MENIQSSKELEEEESSIINLQLKVKLTQEKRDKHTHKLFEALSAIPLNWKAIQLLIFKGADFNIKNRHAEDTTLILAAGEGKLRLVEFLLSNGAYINTQNKMGETALSSATVNGRKDMVKLLLHNDADTNMKNMTGKTPLELARHLKRDNIVKLFETYTKITNLREELRKVNFDTSKLSTQAPAFEGTFKDFVDAYF